MRGGGGAGRGAPQTPDAAPVGGAGGGEGRGWGGVVWLLVGRLDQLWEAGQEGWAVEAGGKTWG